MVYCLAIFVHAFGQLGWTKLVLSWWLLLLGWTELGWTSLGWWAVLSLWWTLFNGWTVLLRWTVLVWRAILVWWAVLTWWAVLSWRSIGWWLLIWIPLWVPYDDGLTIWKSNALKFWLWWWHIWLLVGISIWILGLVWVLVLL